MLDSLFNKVAGLEGLQLYYQETPTQVFSCEYYEIFNNTYFGEHLRTAPSRCCSSVFITHFLHINKRENGVSLNLVCFNILGCRIQ